MKETSVDRREVNKEGIKAANRRRLLALSLHWLVRPLGYLEITDVFKIDLVSLPPLFDIPGYTIKKADADDVRAITQRIKRDEPSAVLDTLWAKGHHCFVAKFQGNIVAYNWIAFSAVQEEEYRYEPKADHAICVDAYTMSEHRGKGLHLLLLLTMLHFAESSGKTLAYTGASVYNLVSWKTHFRIGWQRAFTFAWFRPYFTPGRQPWRLFPERYPLRLDWSQHAWLAERQS